MSNKEELAALMASDGDYEKKISLLKKAVVTVTKQKQEIESRQAQLQEELRVSAQRLLEAQRENTVLQRKVKTLEAQLEHERGSSGGSAFGQNMLKGLSSIMGSSDASGGRGGDRGGASGRGGGGGRSQLSLSAEDVERLVNENEQLHREKYTYKTKLEDAQRASARDAEAQRAEAAQLQAELTELRRSLDAVTDRCDRLNADYLMERAVGDFCRHFFVATLRRNYNSGSGSGRERVSPSGRGEGMSLVAELQWPPAVPRAQASPPSSLTSDAVSAELREAVVQQLQGSCGTIKTLLRGVSVLVVVLREQLPQRERATVGDLVCLRDRLSVFLDAHGIKKDRLMYLLEQLEGYLANVLTPDSAAESGDDALTAKTLVETQDEVLQLFLEWVGLLRAQTPLLVESCVSYLPQGHTYTLHVGRAVSPSALQGSGAAPSFAADPPRTTTDRAEFVEEVTKYGYATLASIEGALTAARMLVQRSPTAYCGAADEEDEVGAGGGSSLAVDVCALLALQQFWWEGCAAVRALHVSTRVLDGSVRDLAEACDKSEVRDALLYLSKCLGTLAAAAEASDTFSGREADDAVEVVPVARAFLSGGLQLPPSSPARYNATGAPTTTTASNGGGGRDGRLPILTPASAEASEEVLVALAAADRAAAAYYTQMNHLYMEMADKEDALQTAAELARQMKVLLEMERAESEQTRRTMQAQISLLSNQLIEMTDTAQAQQQQ